MPGVIITKASLLFLENITWDVQLKVALLQLVWKDKENFRQHGGELWVGCHRLTCINNAS